MSAGSMVEYRGYHLRVQAREWQPGWMANLDVLQMADGIAFRRWWPVPHATAGQVYLSIDEAEAAAVSFGHAFIDSLHARSA